MGAIVNALLIVVGSSIGLLIKQGIKEKIHTRLMQAIGLVVLSIGVKGAMESENTIVVILSMVLGVLIGESFDIDEKITKLVKQLELKLTKGESNNLSQGFINASMIFVVGSMGIIGSLESGLLGNNSTLYTKGLIDGITSIILTSSMGIGVMLSSVPVLIYEGFITIFAVFLQPILSSVVITEIMGVGSLMIIALALNIMGVSEFKVMNFLPAILFPPFLIPIIEMIM